MLTLQEVQDAIIPILRKHNVKRASLFGSIVRGDMHEKSDIDILVEMPQNASLLDRARLKVAIEEKLKIPADVIRFDTIKSNAKASVLSTQVPLHI